MLVGPSGPELRLAGGTPARATSRRATCTAAATRTAAPPTIWSGLGCSPSSTAAMATPTSGSMVIKIAARLGPIRPMPVMNAVVGMAAPVMPPARIQIHAAGSWNGR